MKINFRVVVLIVFTVAVSQGGVCACARALYVVSTTLLILKQPFVENMAFPKLGV